MNSFTALYEEVQALLDCRFGILMTFTLKVTMEARNYYIKSKDFYHWDLELFIFPIIIILI